MGKNPTWKVTIAGPLCEEYSQLFFEAGATGVEICTPESLHAFVPGSQPTVEAFVAMVNSHGFRVSEISEVVEKNWVQECQAVWPPLTIGALTITPIMSAPPPRAPVTGEIFIIPGFGFGTGHHASTRFILELVQRHIPRDTSLSRTLDFGAGSGILALGISTLYGGHIDAIDNDPAAVINGAENVALNGMSAEISMQCGSTELIQGVYDLVLVNLYAELLSAFEPNFYDHLKPNALCIVAGITTESESILSERYTKNRWTLVERLEENGWIAIVYRKHSSS
jgi:ribosomal protein L11 methyltransferase